MVQCCHEEFEEHVSDWNNKTKFRNKRIAWQLNLMVESIYPKMDTNEIGNKFTF